jgi:hypothetical protein
LKIVVCPKRIHKIYSRSQSYDRCIYLRATMYIHTYNTYLLYSMLGCFFPKYTQDNFCIKVTGLSVHKVCFYSSVICRIGSGFCSRLDVARPFYVATSAPVLSSGTGLPDVPGRNLPKREKVHQNTTKYND